MRIGILTQYFPPEMGAPQARLYELAVRLKERGHQITVLTAMPNYPTGKVFPEYKWRLLAKEEMDGLRIIRTAIYPSRSSNLLVRLFSYMSFVISSFALGIWSVGRLDVLVVESPPLFLCLSGIPMSWLTRSRLVLMVSDIWPDVAVRAGMIRGKQVRILEALEAFAYRHSACVALTNPGAVEQVRSRFPEVPCSVISNGVDTRLFRPELRSEAIRAELGIKPGQFAAGYCGLHGLFQGLEVVIDAAKRLRDEHGIVIVMVGDGPTKQDLMAKATAEGLTNILFHPRQPKERMPAILASMDASLIPLSASLPGTMPSKVYEALAAGVPVVVTAGCEAEQLVQRYNIGRLFPAGDDAVLAAAIRELADRADLREQLRTNSLALSRRFDRDRIAGQAEQLLISVANGQPLPAVEW